MLAPTETSQVPSVTASDRVLTQFRNQIMSDPKLAESTKRRYLAEVRDYYDDGRRSFFDAEELQRYAADLPKSRRAFLSAAINRWLDNAIKLVKSQATPQNISSTQATVMRFEAARGSIEVGKQKGNKMHTWLSKEEAEQLLALPDADDVSGLRDRVVLGLLVGAGLRRNEAVSVTFADLARQPVGGRPRVVLSVLGKGAKHRGVPLSDTLATLIERWGDVLGHEGLILRSVDRRGDPGDSLSTTAVFNIVRKYGEMMGHPDLAAHDLRRTYAQVGYENGVPLTQLSKLLGHESVETTQRYLNLDLDLETTASDFIRVPV